MTRRTLADLSPHEVMRSRRRVTEAAIGYAAAPSSETTDLLDRMQAVHDSAVALDAAIRANVPTGLFRGTWEGWIADWTRYYRLAFDGRMLLDDEDLRARLDGYGEDLAGWHDGYAAERRAAGAYVPRAPQQLAAIGGEPPKRAPFIRWWHWMLGGAAVAGGAYYVTRKVAGAGGGVLGAASYARDAVARFRAPARAAEAAASVAEVASEVASDVPRLLP